MSNLKYIGKNILNHDLILKKGDISGSATSTGSFGNLIVDGDSTVNGDLIVKQYIKHKGDTNTFINFTDNHIRFNVGGINFASLEKDASAPYPLTINNGGNRINFRVVDQNTDLLLKTDSDANNVKLYHAGNQKLETKNTGVNVTGSLDITGSLTTIGNISGSATSTGSFGLVLQNGNELSTFLGDRGTETLFSGSLVSTGSFGRLEATDMDIRGTGSFDKLTVGPRSATLQNYSGMKAQLTIEAAQDSALDRAIYIKQTPDDFGYVINTNGSVTGDFSLHNVAGGTEKTNPAISTGQDQKVGIGTFTRPEKLSVGGNIHSTGIVTASSFTGIFQGALSSSAQIASNISGAFAVASASFAADILSNSSSFAARDTLSEATSSKILNGELEFTNITASGNLSIDGVSVFDSHITASGRVNLDGKVFIQSGSIEGDLHVRTNENLMRIGKSTSGLIVSGSEEVSRFATGSDGSIIDLGFTVTDEDGNVVLAGDGDGIHIDGNNYWYNNKYYKVGDGTNNFLNYDALTLKYKGEVIAQTGSFGGEMFINSPTGSMFIGKFTGGIPSSGSDNVSRFATGSDGSIIDLGFTTTNEDGETVFLTTGDGIVRDDKNYWYTTGHFKVGDGQKQIEWNTTDLNISASTVDVTTLKANDVNFAGLPTSDPLITGSLWISGSATSGSYKSGYVMISGIHG